MNNVLTATTMWMASTLGGNPISSSAGLAALSVYINQKPMIGFTNQVNTYVMV